MDERLEEKMILEGCLRTISELKRKDLPVDVYNSLTGMEHKLVDLASLVYDIRVDVQENIPVRSSFSYNMEEIFSDKDFARKAEKAWSPAEIKQLIELRDMGITYDSIADMLKRTSAACRAAYARYKKKIA